jgi:SAM-dependent methyltransferase
MAHRTPRCSAWVPETRIGIWFQGTSVWRNYVLGPALDELFGLLGPDRSARSILDAGCGDGAALLRLRERFGPERLVGVDIDPDMVRKAGPNARAADARVECADLRKLDWSDASFDLVLCHQTLHHVSDQEGALCELHRVLAPGGALLVSESCRSFISRTWVRLFFRHPEESQHSPDAYVQMVERAGFAVRSEDVRHPSPPWARGPRRSRAAADAEPTQLLLVATRPGGPGLGS